MSGTSFTFKDDLDAFEEGYGDDFRRWIDELDEDIIQGEYGYEDGEFSVFPSLWWSLYHRKLTPREAWLVALNEHAKAHDEDRQP